MGRVRKVVILLAVAAMAAAACSSGGKSSTTGKTGSKSPILIGLVTSLTGPASSNFNGAQQGVAARFALQNAQGGVNGHPVRLITGDDTSSVQGGQTAVSKLVEVNKVFSLIFISDLVSAGYRTAHQDDVPVVGAPIDGPEWGQQPNTNMVAVTGDQPGIPPPNTQQAVVAKEAGAKNMAALAIANEEPSIVAEQDFMAGAKAIGLKVGYYNDSTPIGSVNVTSLVLAMKQAGVDGFQSAMLDNTNFAIMTTAKQAGLNLVAPMQDVGYDQALLDDASALQAAQGGIFSVTQVPFEEKTAATQKEQSAFEQYEHFSGVPNLNWSFGWLSGDLTIKGLQAAGSNPTRSSFLQAIRHLKGWNAEGLLAQNADFSLANFGKIPSKQACSYYVRLQGKDFVPMNGGKPICGSYVGS